VDRRAPPAIGIGAPGRCAPAAVSRNVEQLRRASRRSVVEPFRKKSPHAIEQQAPPGLLCLDAQVLLHHGGVWS